MLTIRKEQKEKLDAVMRDRFVVKTVRHLREVFPDVLAAKSDKELVALIEEGIQRAEKYGITGEREVTLFIDLLAGLGSDFANQRPYRWIVRILNDAEYGPPEKMELIYRRLDGQLKPK
jgi:hypothetical protein